MNKMISAKQLRYSIGAFIIASTLLTSNLYYFAKNDSWISVIAGYIISLLIVSIYVILARRYPGCSLIGINDKVFGSWAGKIVSALYVFYFLSLACFNTRDLGDFVKSVILPATPISLIFVIFTCICAWAVYKGPVNMTRYGLFCMGIAVIAIFINSILLLNRTKPETLLPILTLPLKNYLIGAHIVTMLPFCEIIAFMMFIPYMKKAGGFGSAMRSGLAIGAVTLIFVVLRDITVEGRFTAIFSMPTFSSIRYIDAGDILTRLEIVYAVILMMLLFFKVSVVFFASVSGFVQMLNIDSHQKFVLVFGVLIIVYAYAFFVTGAEHTKWNLTAAATYSTFFILVLPFITLVVSTLRRMHENWLVKAQQEL